MKLHQLSNCKIDFQAHPLPQFKHGQFLPSINMEKCLKRIIEDNVKSPNLVWLATAAFFRTFSIENLLYNHKQQYNNSKKHSFY